MVSAPDICVLELKNGRIICSIWTSGLICVDVCPPQAYTEELVELHRRLMALRERNVLQQVSVAAARVQTFVPKTSSKPSPPLLPQIVNLIEETGHFNVTNTTFDFDLFSLDESTVRKLQSYLEATAT